MATSRQHLIKTVGEEQASRVHFLMDYRANRTRYEQQLAAAGAKAAATIAGGIAAAAARSEAGAETALNAGDDVIDEESIEA